MGNKLYLITESSEIYKIISSPFFLNTYVEEKEDEIVLHVINSWTKELLQDKLDALTNVYKKKIVVIVDESLYEKKEEKKQVRRRGNLSGYSYLIQEYTDTPYFIGESNSFAYETANTFISAQNKQNIFFIHGGVGTGKSHLLHKIAHNVLQSGKNVYLNNSNNFLEDIKACFGKNNTVQAFIEDVSSNDYCIIDDFQKFNNKDLIFVSDILFEILNAIISKGKKAAFSSDVSPYMYQFLHERIKSRLLMGYVCNIKKPDEKVKRQYVNYYSELHNIPIEEDIVNYIVQSTINIREVKMLLNICEMLHERKDLGLKQLIEKTPQSIVDVKNIIINDLLTIVHGFLRDYYDVSSIVATSKSKKSRIEAVVDSIAYYLLFDKMDPKSLRNRLKILAKHHNHYYKRGESFFRELPQNIQIKLNEMVTEK